MWLIVPVVVVTGADPPNCLVLRLRIPFFQTSMSFGLHKLSYILWTGLLSPRTLTWDLHHCGLASGSAFACAKLMPSLPDTSTVASPFFQISRRFMRLFHLSGALPHRPRTLFWGRRVRFRTSLCPHPLGICMQKAYPVSSALLSRLSLRTWGSQWRPSPPCHQLRRTSSHCHLSSWLLQGLCSLAPPPASPTSYPCVRILWSQLQTASCISPGSHACSGLPCTWPAPPRLAPPSDTQTFLV